MGTEAERFGMETQEQVPGAGAGAGAGAERCGLRLSLRCAATAFPCSPQCKSSPGAAAGRAVDFLVRRLSEQRPGFPLRLSASRVRFRDPQRIFARAPLIRQSFAGPQTGSISGLALSHSAGASPAIAQEVGRDGGSPISG